MKHLANLMLTMLTVLLLAACSTTVGTNAQLDAPRDHRAEVIGAISHGP